jgi:hypothetical protein
VIGNFSKKSFNFSNFNQDATFLLKEIIDLALSKIDNNLIFYLDPSKSPENCDLYLDLKKVEFFLSENNIVNFGLRRLLDCPPFDIRLCFLDELEFSSSLDKEKNKLEIKVNAESIKSNVYLTLLSGDQNKLNESLILKLKTINEKISDRFDCNVYLSVKTSNDKPVVFSDNFLDFMNQELKSKLYHPIFNYLFKGVYQNGFDKLKVFPSVSLTEFLKYSNGYLIQEEFSSFQRRAILCFKDFYIGDGQIVALVKENLVSNLGDLNTIKSFDELLDLLELKTVTPEILFNLSGLIEEIEFKDLISKVKNNLIKLEMPEEQLILQYNLFKDGEYKEFITSSIVSDLKNLDFISKSIERMLSVSIELTPFGDDEIGDGFNSVLNYYLDLFEPFKENQFLKIEVRESDFYDW